MGLVPPFGWRDVETFEGDVACTGIHLSTFDVTSAAFRAHCWPDRREVKSRRNENCSNDLYQEIRLSDHTRSYAVFVLCFFFY